MQRLYKMAKSLTVESRLPFVVGISLLVMHFAYACGKDNGAGSGSYQCEVTLTLVPSRIGNLSSPSGTGQGTGEGGTQQEALTAAYKSACSQLNLSSDVRSRCETGQDFGVAVTSNGVTLVSAVNRSQRCSGSSSF
ncbi:MAG: hypothetical protein OXU79_17520 [Gemmatimonadota bacterium]|nr:hypothetical protein [Gemmatimonadota bacterium]